MATPVIRILDRSQGWSTRLEGVHCKGIVIVTGWLYNRKGKKLKTLKWFEETFEHVSGEDQLLQLDEFTRALHTNGVSNVTVIQLALDHDRCPQFQSTAGLGVLYSKRALTDNNVWDLSVIMSLVSKVIHYCSIVFRASLPADGY